jgi:hypothetical protein
MDKRQIVKIETSFQRADILTKWLLTDIFEDIRLQLCSLWPHSIERECHVWLCWIDDLMSVFWLIVGWVNTWIYDW